MRVAGEHERLLSLSLSQNKATRRQNEEVLHCSALLPHGARESGLGKGGGYSKLGKGGGIKRCAD